MSNERYLIQLEQKLNAKMKSIQAGTMTPKESKIGVLFKMLKDKDEVLYESMMEKYKKILEAR